MTLPPMTLGIRDETSAKHYFGLIPISGIVILPRRGKLCLTTIEASLSRDWKVRSFNLSTSINQSLHSVCQVRVKAIAET